MLGIVLDPTYTANYKLMGDDSRKWFKKYRCYQGELVCVYAR